jgi:predicted DCC family thiol-disulfide oxidoreductase YuxK
MKTRWILFYDGACPLCVKTKSKIKNLLRDDIKLSVVDLNSSIAKSKGYDLSHAVLEVGTDVYHGHKAWLKIVSHTKYAWASNILIRPCFIVFYHLVSRNRKLFSKLIS